MLIYFVSLLSIFTIISTVDNNQVSNVYGNVLSSRTSPNGCVSFSVGPGTGCSWMCSYCANQLGTNNYYFTNGVCTYQEGGCVGNPQPGVSYTCCGTVKY